MHPVALHDVGVITKLYLPFLRYLRNQWPWISLRVIIGPNRYALRGLCDRNSVRPSVYHTRGLSTWFDLRSRFLQRVVAHDSSFCKYQDHPEIRRRSPRARALNEGGVGTNWRFLTNKPPYIRNGARYDKGYYWSLIGNRTCAFDWYQNRRPWLTLKWPLTAIMHSVALHTCILRPTTKIWMKIDPYNQRQKCSPGILVSIKVSFMRIFVGVRWRGASNENGVVKNWDFRFFRSLNLLNLHI